MAGGPRAGAVGASTAPHGHQGHFLQSLSDTYSFRNPIFSKPQAALEQARSAPKPHRMAVIKGEQGGEGEKAQDPRVVDVKRMGPETRRALVQSALSSDDNEQFLKRVRERMDRCVNSALRHCRLPLRQTTRATSADALPLKPEAGVRAQRVGRGEQHLTRSERLQRPSRAASGLNVDCRRQQLACIPRIDDAHMSSLLLQGGHRVHACGGQVRQAGGGHQGVRRLARAAQRYQRLPQRDRGGPLTNAQLNTLWQLPFGHHATCCFMRTGLPVLQQASMSIMFLDAVPQGLIQKVGIKTAQKRSFKILQGISGTIKPVRLCKCRQ